MSSETLGRTFVGDVYIRPERRPMTGEAGMLKPQRDLVAENNAQIRAEEARRATTAALKQQIADLTRERDALAAKVAAAEGALNEARDVLDPFVMGDPSAVDQVNQAYRIVVRALAAQPAPTTTQEA